MNKFKQFHPLEWKEPENYRPIAIIKIGYREVSEQLGIFFFEAQDDLGYYKCACLEDMQGKRFILRNCEQKASHAMEIWSVAENIDIDPLVHHFIDILGVSNEKVVWKTDAKHQWEGLL